MANYNAIKTATNAYIRSNGRQEITGNILNAVLIATIDALGKYFQFAGVADRDTDPGTPDENVIYITGEAGTYTNFGGIVVNAGEMALLVWNGQWRKQVIKIVPEYTSQLQNDSGFINNAVGNLLNYYNKSETYTKGQVDDLIAAVHQFEFVVADELPEASADTMYKIYLIPADGADTDNVKDEYVTIEEEGVYSWEMIGTTAVDLSDYPTNEQMAQAIDDALAAYISSINASVDANVGTPSVDVTYSSGVLTLAFHNLKGQTGEQGVPGPAGVTSANVTVDNNTGIPSVEATLNAGVLTLTFHNLKGAQGDTGSSVAYPFTLVNNTTTDDPLQALTAAMGKYLQDQVSQLEAEVNTLMGRYYGVFGLEEELPDDASAVGFAFIGGAEPLALWEFDGNEWSDTGIEISGITGPQGVGIGTIEQTTTSTESEGQNVITITKTDGETATFIVRNGKQGLRGPQGLQGNPGSSVAYPFSLENGLNSTDTTKALTAAMGKFLNDTKAGVNDNSDVDLEIADGAGHILAKFADGHFQVKNFDTKEINSNTVPKVSDIGVMGDFSLSDQDGNILLLLENGHIRTKEFDSAKLPINAIKKAVFMGDSITHGVYSYWHNGGHAETDRYNGFDITNLASVSQATAYPGIHYFFGLLSGAEMVNLGKRGSGWVADTRNIGNALAVANSYNFADVDFVALCFGVNDYIQGVTIGDIDTQASGTLVGNMCATIEKILTDNPLCKVVVYSPYNTWGQVSYGGDYTSNVLYGSESTNYALGHEIGGNTLQDIIDAETEVCDHYGIQIVDLSRSNVCNRFTIKEIMVDGLHPTKASYPKLAAEIYGKGNFGA